MSHIHESPKSMTFPLIVLAMLSVIGGFMGFPEVFGGEGSHWLNEFLAPVFAPSAEYIHAHHLSHATEYILMGTVVAFTIVMIIIAYVMYVSKNQVPAEDAQLSGIHKTLYHKYYIDELYNAIIVKPLYWLSGIFDTVIEKMGIDKLVNGVGETVVLGSKAARFLQPGTIGYYIFAMVLGAGAILLVQWLG